MGWKCKISRIVLAAASAGSLQIAPAHAALITYDFQGRFYASFDPTNQISRNGVSVSNGFSGTVTYNTNAAPTFPNNSINTAIYYGAITSFSVSIGSYSGIIQNSFFPNTNNFVVIGDNQPQGDFVGLSSNVQSSVFSTNSRSISQLLFVDPTRSAINTLNIPSNIYKFPDPNFSRFRS